MIKTSPRRFGVGVGVGVGLDLGLGLGVSVGLVALKAEVCESMPAAEWLHVAKERGEGGEGEESALEAED